MMAHGLADPSIPNFNTFQEKIMRLNKALPSSFRDPDPVVAPALAEIVSRISPDLRSAMRLEMRLAGASGDMDTTTTVILSAW